MLSVPSILRVDAAFCLTKSRLPGLSVPLNSRVDTACHYERHVALIAVSSFKFKGRCSQKFTTWFCSRAVSTFKFKGRYSFQNSLDGQVWLSVPSNLRVDTALQVPLAVAGSLSVPSNLRVDAAQSASFFLRGLLSVPSNLRVDTVWHGASHSIVGCQYLQF